MISVWQATPTQKTASVQKPAKPAYPHETQAQRDAEAMAAAEAFQKEVSRRLPGEPARPD